MKSEQILFPQPAKKFSAFYGSRMFITVFTRARHWSLSWARWVHSIPFHHIFLRSVLILSSHLLLQSDHRLILQKITQHKRIRTLHTCLERVLNPQFQCPEAQDITRLRLCGHKPKYLEWTTASININVCIETPTDRRTKAHALADNWKRPSF